MLTEPQTQGNVRSVRRTPWSRRMWRESGELRCPGPGAAGGRRRACACRTSVCSAQGRRQHAGLRIPLQGAQSRTRVGGPELRAFAPGVCSALRASLGGHRTLPIGPRSQHMEETLRGFPPRLLSGGGSPGHCWVLSSIPGPLSCDNENVPWGQNCLGSIHASACLRGWRCAQLEAPRYPEVEQPRLQWGAHSLMNRNKLLSYGARLRTAFPP